MYACSLRTDYVFPDPPHYLEDYVWPAYEKQVEKLKLKNETSISKNMSDYQLAKNILQLESLWRVFDTLILVQGVTSSLPL